MLVSAIHQHESTIGIHMSPPPWTLLPSPTTLHPLGYHRACFELPKSCSKFPLVIYFAYGSVCFHAALSICRTFSFPPTSSCLKYTVLTAAQSQNSFASGHCLKPNPRCGLWLEKNGESQGKVWFPAAFCISLSSSAVYLFWFAQSLDGMQGNKRRCQKS